jgi:hypothetical protein
MSSRSVRPASRRTIPVLLALALAACDDGVDPVFSRQALPPGIALLPSDRVGVVVQPVTGVSEPFATEMAQAVAEALQVENVPASLRGGAADSYFLSGDSAISRNGDGTVTLRVTWDLTDADGTLVGSHEEREVMPAPNEATGPLLSAVAARAAPALAALIQGGQPPQPVPVAADNRGVGIGGIAGAPGTGARDLAAALAVALPLHGVAVSDENGTPAFRLEGDVAVTPVDGATERITLRWRVIAADGAELGRLDQQNDIPAGSLDGAWGEVAFLVADGVASGVAAILERARR